MTTRNRFNIPLVGAGKLIIGSDSSITPTAANLTQGTGINITNADGAITITNTSVKKTKFFSATTPDDTRTSSGTISTITLPANAAAVGDLIEIWGELVLTETSGVYTGDVRILTGSTSSAFYNGFNIGAGKNVIFSFWGFLIPTSSTNSFLMSQCTGIQSSGTQLADAQLNTACTIDITANASLGTSLQMTGGGAGFVKQRMLSVRVTGN